MDLFASKLNKKCKKYCSWRVDKDSLGNAWDITWTGQLYWINPPWELISRVLTKCKEDHTRALVCLPMWEAAPWWRQLQDMMTAIPTIIDVEAIYNNPEGKKMPPPRWATIFTTIQG